MSLNDDRTTLGEYFEPIELVPADPEAAAVSPELVRALTADIRHVTRRQMLSTPALAEELVRKGWRPAELNTVRAALAKARFLREYQRPWPDSTYVYVASSWRNPIQPTIVDALKRRNVGAYDFRNPAPGESGFAWSEIDPDWQQWTAREYVAALDHPVAEHGYGRDFSAMQRADTFVLVLPCGRSAHLELGWAVGAGKRTAILTRDGEEPELMAKMVDLITDDVDELLAWVIS